jgi:hypothetical protein
LEHLSATIRFGVKAWEFVQTYPSALRTVAMFVLTAAAGTSMMLMMGHHSASNDAPITAPPPAAASTEPAWTAKPGASATDTEDDSSGAANLVPTAIGPRGLVSPPTGNAASLPIVVTEPTDAAKSSSSESLPRLQTNEHLAARGPGKRPATAASYPTTPYPLSNLPGLNTESLPQAQTSEPAVARFRGNIEPLSR